MKATDFDFKKELSFDLDTGNTTFKDSRFLLFDANTIGMLRQGLIKELGLENARRFFLRFGFQQGYSDFLQMKVNFTFDTEMELLASGPVIHTWEGIVKATPTEIEFNRETGHFFFTGVWTNSYEAQQHLSFNEIAAEPVCWSVMGYASGWCTAFFGHPLIAIEPVCVGMGDDHCEWKIQPPSAWGDEADLHAEAFADFFEGVHDG